MNTPAIIERAAAKEAGLRHYYTGRPCTNGHTAPRYVQSGACSACIADSVARSRAAYAVEQSEPRRLQREEYGRTVRVHAVRLPLASVDAVRAIVSGMLCARFPLLHDDGRVDMNPAPRIGPAAGGTAVVRFLLHADDVPALQAMADGECARVAA